MCIYHELFIYLYIHFNMSINLPIQVMNNQYILEICVYSVEGAIAAQSGGANRIELCDNQPDGGTTPSAAAIEIAREKLNIDLNIMIRPRGGDFCYSTIEFETMTKDIQVAKALGANGVVLGILLPNGKVDVKRTWKLIDLARPMNVTFHRAFDMTRDPVSAMEEIIGCEADRILTSGQKNSAPEGVEKIKELVGRAGNRIIIMPGSGINEQTVSNVALKTGATEFHMSAKKKIDGTMKYRKSGINMGGKENDEYHHWITDSEQIKNVIQILSSIKT